jgi:uncharacterized membrane protein
MNEIEARVTIRRPIEEVFAFYRDFKNLPRFLGDVMAVEQKDPLTTRWTIQGPLGIQAKPTVKVTSERVNESLYYEMGTLPGLKGYWEVYFSPGSRTDETEVRVVLKARLGRLGYAALALLGKFPAQEVSSNLQRLKELLETGRVTDTRYSVAGKFAPAPSASTP